MKHARFVTLVCFLTLTLTLFTRPAFANSITWLGVETQTNFYINVGPSGSTLSVTGVGSSLTDSFQFHLWDVTSQKSTAFLDGTFSVSGSTDLSGTLTDIRWNHSTDVITAQFDGLYLTMPLNHVGLTELSSTPLTTVPEPGTLGLLGTGLCLAGGVAPQEAHKIFFVYVVRWLGGDRTGPQPRQLFAGGGEAANSRWYGSVLRV